MPKIIIAEDDPMISDIYVKKFSDVGFEVFTADAGDQVLNLAQKNNVDIVLLDLIIPKINGFEVIKKLRTEKYNPHIKIVVFSNLSQGEDKKKAMELGADGFLVKADYAPNELVREISRYLNQFSEEKKNEIKLNGNNGDSPSTNGNVKKILMMEDEEVFRDMFGEKLKSDGYQVTFAENGALGVKEALAGDYDLYIVDMIMPAMTGDEIVAKLKLEDKTKNIPIIVLSASVDENTQRGVESMGVESFFVKTQLIPSELSKRVEEILR